MPEERTQSWVCFLIFLSLPLQAVGQESCEPVAEVVSAQGEISINSVRIDNLKAVQEQNRRVICVGDLIRAGNLSRAAITILDTEVVVRVDQNTELRLTASPQKSRSFLSLVRGAINVFSPSPQSLEVETAFVNAAVEGTEFQVRVAEKEAVVTVLEGKVRVYDPRGEAVKLSAGESAVAGSGRVPQIDRTIVSSQTVNWTLFYEPVIVDPGSTGGPSAGSAAFHALRGARALEVGAWELADSEIDAALRLQPDNAQAWALKLVAAITRNQRDAAGRLIENAPGTTENSASALIAISIWQQYEFDLAGALQSLHKAVALEADNALARARLAEILLAMGRLGDALQAASQADALASTARSKTVLGYAYLAQMKIPESISAFREGIQLRSDDPLPHLGLGLAKIRTGNLEQGIHDIEIAAGVDGNNALARSYLGKGFYEVFRSASAERQFEIAKQLDPEDPTPWFYDAIRKQSVNLPFEALQDINQSINLNGNRAVYRSRLLLDEDLAARSASLGQIFRNLGFDDLALVEGWKSVATEPANYSGHRLLADAYASRPNHQIARTNELFQSQMLQPSNMTPVQPQLANTNLFLQDGAGPSTLAFNEFNPLFNRNRVGVQVSAVAGGNDTFGDDLVLYGIANRWTYSVGQYHYETDGFRDNNDLKQDILNGIVQYRPSYRTSVQAEIRSSELEKGDLSLRFDPEIFSPSLRIEEDVDSLRLGLQHLLDYRSKLLVSAVYQDANLSAMDAPSLSIEADTDGYRLAIQHLLKLEKIGLTSGASYLSDDLDELVEVSFSIPFPPFMIEDSQKERYDIRHTSAYAYAQFFLVENTTITLGGSADFLRGLAVKEDAFYPKIGLIWEPATGTTLRAAAFKTIQRPFISKQNIQPSLEPTQVAGFNQFFFGAEGEEVWRYGVGLDQTYSENVYCGVELSMRDRDIPVLTVDPVVSLDYWDTEEYLGRMYVYYSPQPRIALSANYQYENIDHNGEVALDGEVELSTHRASLDFNYFHPNGIGAGVTVSYLDQQGDFLNAETRDISSGNDNFWVMDASLDYRLPRRMGMISLVANNLLDEEFYFQDSDAENPTIMPERWLLLRFTLTLDW